MEGWYIYPLTLQFMNRLSHESRSARHADASIFSNTVALVQRMTALIVKKTETCGIIKKGKICFSKKFNGEIL